MDTLKRIEKIIRESAFDKKKKKHRLNFNPGLALTGVQTTWPWFILISDHLLQSAPESLHVVWSLMVSSVLFSRSRESW